MSRIVCLAALIATALTGPVLACDTLDDVVRGVRGQAARVTVIRETGELSRALSFMLGHADEVQPADALVVIEQAMSAEVVLLQRGCATLKTLSNRQLVTELLKRAKGDQGDLI